MGLKFNPFTGALDQVAVVNQGDFNDLFIDANGNVGIGTTSPGYQLVVEGSSPYLQLKQTGTNTGSSRVIFGDADTASPGQLIYDHTNNSLQTITNGTERLRIDSSGRLLVGTSTSTSQGNVTGNIQIAQAGGTAFGLSRWTANAFAPIINLAKSRGASVGLNAVVNNSDELGRIEFSGDDGTDLLSVGASILAQVDGTPGANDMPGRLVFSTTADGASSPTERMRITNAGILYSAPTYSNTTADAANMFVSASGQFYRSTSSLKYKTNVETLEDSYADAILNIRPVWYRSTCDGDCPEHSYWGFIAEEVAAVDSRLVQWKTVDVTYDEKGSAVEAPCDPEPDGVAYERFVPHLLNLIKRQKEQIEALEARLSALEAQ